MSLLSLIRVRHTVNKGSGWALTAKNGSQPTDSKKTKSSILPSSKMDSTRK